MALVTDMSGECSAGVTPHTVWKPQMDASPNLVTIDEKAGPGEAAARPMTPSTPPVVVSALRRVGAYRSGGPAGSIFAGSFLGGALRA